MKSRSICGLIMMCVAFFGASVSRAGDSAYDHVVEAYRPYLSADDALSLPLKLRAVSNDPYTYWRGTKPIFYTWAKEHCRGWLSDQNAFTLCHGDLHVGNLGSYASDSSWAKLAFGLVDFDEACVMPFQIELLQGYISLRLIAAKSALAMTGEDQRKLITAILDQYNAALRDSRTASELLADESMIQPLFWDARKDYRKVLKQLVHQDKFKAVIMDKDGNLKDLLRPSMDLRRAFARGIAQAIARDQSAKAAFRLSTEEDVFQAIRDIAQRTRVDSSGSQGLQKYYVLLDKPFRGINHDAVIYLKREVSAAAERAGMIPESGIPAGQRVAQAAQTLARPGLWLNLWCDIRQSDSVQSYWITLREPWSEDLSTSAIDMQSLLTMARVWASAAGAAHRNPRMLQYINTPETQHRQKSLAEDVLHLGQEYLDEMQSQYQSFIQDARLSTERQKVDGALRQLTISAGSLQTGHSD